MELKGKTVLLTGATGGIGQSIAAALSAAGARMVLGGRNEEALAALIDQLPGEGHVAVAADLADPRGRERLKNVAREQGVDVLINNAGTGQLGALEDASDGQLEHIVALNLLVPMMVCRDMIPLLESRGQAAIVNVGSILGSIGYAGSAAYCGSKFGLRGFTESLRRELANSPIQVFYLAPRATDTTLNSPRAVAMNRELGVAVDAPGKVADALLQQLRSGRPLDRFIGWPEKFFVRLNGLFPRLVDKALRKQLPVIERFSRDRDK